MKIKVIDLMLLLYFLYFYFQVCVIEFLSSFYIDFFHFKYDRIVSYVNSKTIVNIILIELKKYIVKNLEYI